MRWQDLTGGAIWIVMGLVFIANAKTYASIWIDAFGGASSENGLIQIMRLGGCAAIAIGILLFIT